MSTFRSDFGTPNHAASVTEGRHPATRDALQWLAFSHLPEQLRRFAYPFYSAAVGIIDQVRADSPELTTALNVLVTAKDHAMRAGIKGDTGRAGSIPRPQEVVDPPVFTGMSAEPDLLETSQPETFAQGQAPVPMTRPIARTGDESWSAFSPRTNPPADADPRQGWARPIEDDQT